MVNAPPIAVSTPPPRMTDSRSKNALTRLVHSATPNDTSA